jgi:hypothetical protein
MLLDINPAYFSAVDSPNLAQLSQPTPTGVIRSLRLQIQQFVQKHAGAARF